MRVAGLRNTLVLRPQQTLHPAGHNAVNPAPSRTHALPSKASENPSRKGTQYSLKQTDDGIPGASNSALSPLSLVPGGMEWNLIF